MVDNSLKNEKSEKKFKQNFVLDSTTNQHLKNVINFKMTYIYSHIYILTYSIYWIVMKGYVLCPFRV